MSKSICPEFVCPHCGNKEVFVDIEMVSHACVFPGMEEPSDEVFENREKLYIFECDECGYSKDGFSLNDLIKSKTLN